MAGIYFHIPFCKQACSYCDFYFTTHQNEKEKLLRCMDEEIVNRLPAFHFNEIKSIYFGGGTPSVLSYLEIQQLISKATSTVALMPDAEITLEANPDNLSMEFLTALKTKTLVNRLSIGMQSFHASELELMYRAHNVAESIQAFKNAREVGFENISLDLIYGVPGSTLTSWKANVQRAIDLNPEHLSAYCLTIEDNTRLKYWIEKGRHIYPEESLILEQSELLMEMTQSAGYEHYEISNFAKPNQYAKHNTNYWKGEPYLGIGPSAHSFKGNERSWNISNTKEYILRTGQNKVTFETETLSKIDRFNEFIMIHLRTQWGLHTNKIEELFGPDYLDAFIQQGEKIDKTLLQNNGDLYTLTKQGKHQADGIASSFFLVTSP